MALWSPMNRTESQTRLGRADNGWVEAAIPNIQHREWWLWTTAILITLLLTVGILSFAVPSLSFGTTKIDSAALNTAVRALVGLVLLFDLYTVWQQVQIYRIRRQLAEREELSRLISENAADMIALVDSSGHRIYNSPSYGKTLGYTKEELRDTPPLEQIHP